MLDFLTLDDFSFEGKTVLLRADLNVPMKDGKVSDDTRLVRLRPTLEALSSCGAKIVILSHFGRPKGGRDEKYSLRPVAAALAEVCGRSVSFAEDCIGPAAAQAIEALRPGEALVLENTRFHEGEEAGDPVFARELAKLGDVFVNDAFSAAHRAHASTTLLADLMPACAGRLMEEELTALERALEHPLKPVAAVVGGAKISTKLDLLHNLVAKVDLLILGGGMANTFLAAKGCGIGKSLHEPDMLETSRAIMAEAQTKGCEILLPQDVVVAPELKADAPIGIVSANETPSDQMIFDIGPFSIETVRSKLRTCRTIIWNGPFGVFEVPPFDKATNEIAQMVVGLTKSGAILSVAGGGDTVAALANAKALEGFSYVSTAGGAFLEWMEGKTLPGVEALRKKKAA